MIEVFGGYNHNLRINDGEFYDMVNMTSDNYPILSPRKARETFIKSQNLTGMTSKDVLCYVDGQNIVIGEDVIDMGLSDEPKTLVSMASYVIILPDKKFINTANLDDHGDIEAETSTTVQTTFTICKVDGAEYDKLDFSPTAPTNPKNMDLWIDTSTTPNSLKQYSENSKTWVSVASTYIKISSVGIGKDFEVGDGVLISGIESKAIADLNSTMVIQAKGDDFIVVIGIIDQVTTQTAPITIKRLMPTLDYVIESGNRLWGCRYGEAQNGEIVNEIYASKLGDFKNWNSFQGISTDSYTASCGSDGAFTGAITHLGYPIFFKENCMHKVYGNFPANYQIQTTDCRGVQKGSHKSLAIVNEILYYKSRLGVCAYDGSLPVEVSTSLGDVAYFDAVGGAHGNKYYISMADGAGKYHFFVYDTSKGMWHKEDNTKVFGFCSHKNQMYYIDKALGEIRSVFGSEKATEAINWMAESGVIGFDSPDKKYISNMMVRLSLEFGSKVYFYIMYDSSGKWEHVGTIVGNSLRSTNVPVRPHRCDHFRLKIEGEGGAKIYSICKTLEQGSDY
jgi:hypothetical protein